MKKTVLVLLLTIFAANLYGQEIIGSWYGKLSVPGRDLRLVFNIAQISIDSLSATMDSPDQGAKGIPVTKVQFKDSVLTIEIAPAMIQYSGRLSSDNQIYGTFKQMGASFEMNLSREPIKKAALNRPQEPQAPYDYRSQDLIFDNLIDSVRLAATLTMPKTGHNFPAVVLISGSGAQDRNSEILEHKPFLVIADYLTRNGIAVLRFDDRGTAQSTGDHSKATSQDFARDVQAAVDYLKTRPEINPKKIGLIGHSEGGLIAPMVAAQDKSVDFIVLLAGPGLQGKDILLLQSELISRASGISDSAVIEARKINNSFYDKVFRFSDVEQLKNELRTQVAELSRDMPSEQSQVMEAQVLQLAQPWMRFFITYDPIPTLEKVTCAVLAVNGEKDLQVPAKENLSTIKAALKRSSNEHYTIHTFPGLNHLFQQSVTGLPSEYLKIEQTFAPEALEYITNWIKKQ